MKYNVHQILMKTMLENINLRVREYLIENETYLIDSDFYINPRFLGIDIMFSKSDSNYLVNFNNDDRLSFKEYNTNPFMIKVEGKGMAKLSNLNLNGILIERGVLLGKEDYAFFKQNTKEFMDSYIYAINYPVNDVENKLDILNQFDLFLKENPKELKIDKFIENNSFILELSLHLTDLHHSMELENIEENFNQNLIPDVIAYKPLDKRWYIVDYKRSKRNIVKKPNEVRSGFFAEVNDLAYQLKDYMDYFNGSKIQTNHIKEKHDIFIKYPKAIGIIGKVDKKDEEPYLKATRNLPRDIDMYPYNYMIDECRRVLAFQ